jgi:hypothetical protein
MVAKRFSEWAAVAIATAGGAVLFLEIIRSRMPDATSVWLFVAAVGVSLLTVGMGALAVSAVRLFLSVRQPDEAMVHSVAKDHLGCVAMVLVGFALTALALFVLG